MKGVEVKRSSIILGAKPKYLSIKFYDLSDRREKKIEVFFESFKCKRASIG